ncbi:MAG: hypoxanthine phosphoribosyltransferase [Flavobacteriaceae bacterium]|nr:hypoxanthine phosphoribosyltransferase [Flavobacteriaceae bacterium]
MNLIKLHDKQFKPFIKREVIAKYVNYLANEIATDLGKDEVPVFIGILNGSFMFAADFVREYPHDCHISFVKLASYEGTSSTGKIKQLFGLNENLKGKTVVILEDIIDTGNTLSEIYEIFKEKQVKKLVIATLFFKPDVFRKGLHIDYIGKSIEDKFIVGYGLDYDGLGRNLPDIYQLND